MTFYALYRGDRFVVEKDTLQEMADFMGIKLKSASFLSTPCAHRRHAGQNANLIYRYKLEEEA